MPNLKKLKRPMPPEDLCSDYGGSTTRPAPELEAWLRKHFIDPDGELYRVEHAHLEQAIIGCLWTDVRLRVKQKPVTALTESLNFQGNKWAQARAKQQLGQWFGVLPDFLITFYAPQCNELEDLEFCAVSRHELLHCGQELDAFDCPKFTKDGKPKFAIMGHDVEEFVAVTEDFGVPGSAGKTHALVRAANKAPLVGLSRIAACCGTCLR